MKTGKHLKYKGSCVLPHVLSVVWFIISRVGQCDASKCFKKFFVFLVFFFNQEKILCHILNYISEYCTLATENVHYPGKFSKTYS